MASSNARSEAAMLSATCVAGTYRSLVPEQIRRRLRLNRAWRNVRWLARDVKWRTMSQVRKSELVEQRLNLGEDFWLLLMGVTNSGTTLFHDIIASHRRVRSLPWEGQFFTRELPLGRQHGVGRLWSFKPEVFRLTEKDDPTPALRIKYDWSKLYPSRPGILLEKTPLNSIRSRWLQHNFSPSRFIAIVRSPYAVCEGLRRRTGCDIASAATQWARTNEILLEDTKYLTHVMRIRYEDFCAEPIAFLERIQVFLGLPDRFDVDLSREFDVHNVDDGASTISNMNLKSMRRLTSSDIETINRITVDVMRRWGYDVIEPSALAELQQAA